ncbi:MAG TPA: alkyl sulfatase dimerization domain-containing protein [Acidimicrobiales bacterium]
MSDLLTTADSYWNQGLDPSLANPVSQPTGEWAEVADGTMFLSSFANVITFDTDDGVVMIDAGHLFVADTIHQKVREWRPDSPLHTCVYTHGHVDHVFAVPKFDAEAESKGWRRPTVVSHRAVPERFDRYVLTAGYNGAINARQFSSPGLQWPTEYRYPDETYDTERQVAVGDLTLELRHDRGETDDHTWVFDPATRVLCTGDLFIWCVPNAGNPQKVPRYCRDWYLALREMATLDPEILLPGHGVPIVGADRVRQALTETAELLESIHDQTVAIMNTGAPLNDVIHGVTVPAHLLERPYLTPIYDDPEFIIRNIWRLYGGWHDGIASGLKPARTAALAGEIAALAGGASHLADRAAALAGDDATDHDLRLAGHLADLAAQAAPDDTAVHAIRASVYRRRQQHEPSLMAKGVFGAAARDSEQMVDQ